MSTHAIELCQHIKISGSRCGAPAMRDQQFCRFHEACFAITIDVSTSAAVPRAPFLLPALEDATSIQVAISQVCEHLLHRRLDPNKAGVLLYAMQVASSNLGRLAADRTEAKIEVKAEDKNHSPHRDKNDGDKNGESQPAPISTGQISTAEISTSHDDASGAPDRLPPGTIHASQQPRRRRSAVGRSGG
jgi:hypothetical protein